MKKELKIILFALVICSIAVLFIGFFNQSQSKKSVSQKEDVKNNQSIIENQEQEKQEEINQEEVNNEKPKENANETKPQEKPQNNTKPEVIIGSLDFGSDDALMLHKISIAEAGNQSVESMALIMLVVLNRTWSETFPNSIYEVIHQSGQFTPVSNGSYDRAQPNEKSAKAMELVLSGWNESQGALYFETCKGESWHSKNLQLLFEKEGTRYYK